MREKRRTVRDKRDWVPAFDDRVDKGTVCRYAAPPRWGRKKEQEERDMGPPFHD